MSEIRELTDAEKAYLEPFLPPTTPEDCDCPFVTLTYACSLDGMIASGPGIKTTISGPDTKSMTHYLRMKHDAILIGVGTAEADDPSLNCRYPGATFADQPRPIILDRTKRWNVYDSKIREIAQNRKGKAPWIIHKPVEWQAKDVMYETDPDDVLFALGGDRIFATDEQDLFQTLKQKGIHSIMVEGGAQIIKNFISKPRFVESTIITIAPTWLGEGGVVASPPGAMRLTKAAWRQFGADAVLCGRPECTAGAYKG